MSPSFRGRVACDYFIECGWVEVKDRDAVSVGIEMAIRAALGEFEAEIFLIRDEVQTLAKRVARRSNPPSPRDDKGAQP